MSQQQLLEKAKDMSSHGLTRTWSRYSKNTVCPWYDPDLAIEFERLETKGFAGSLFEKMQELNYSRFIEQENWEHPEFLDDP